MKRKKTKKCNLSLTEFNKKKKITNNQEEMK